MTSFYKVKWRIFTEAAGKSQNKSMRFCNFSRASKIGKSADFRQGSGIRPKWAKMRSKNGGFGFKFWGPFPFVSRDRSLCDFSRAP